MRNTELDEAQTKIKIVKRNINNLRYADDTTLMAESKLHFWLWGGGLLQRIVVSLGKEVSANEFWRL